MERCKDCPDLTVGTGTPLPYGTSCVWLETNGIGSVVCLKSARYKSLNSELNGSLPQKLKHSSQPFQSSTKT